MLHALSVLYLTPVTVDGYKMHVEEGKWIATLCGPFIN